MSRDPVSRLMTLAQAAEVLQVSVVGMRWMIRHRHLPYRRVGRLLRIHPDELDAWTKAHRQEGAAALRLASSRS